jgi:hypothetical protein
MFGRCASVFKADDGAAGAAAVDLGEARAGADAGGHDFHSAPIRRSAAVGDEGGMASGDVDALSFGAVQIGDGFQDARTDAESLEVGQDDEAMDAVVIAAADEGERCAEGHWRGRVSRCLVVWCLADAAGSRVYGVLPQRDETFR